MNGIPISNNTFGGDPCPGQRKSLVVIYKFPDSNSILVKAGVEGDSLILPYYRNPFTINRAVYGSQARFIDITQRMQEYVDFDPHNQNIDVGSQAFMAWFCYGGDPDYGNAKTLYLEFQRGGISNVLHACANDGERISLFSYTN